MEPNEPLISLRDNIIMFYDAVTPESALILNDLLTEAGLNSMSLANKYNVSPPPITLRINSDGGTLTDALAVTDYIKRSPVPVYTIVDGYCASAATLISVVGHKRFINPNSFMLIHQLSAGGWGTFQNQVDDTGNSKKLMQCITSIYLEHTNLKLKKIKALLQRDKYINASKCLKWGFVDAIIGTS